ncbi:MAG: hypothetical protein ACU4F9_06100 [Arcticibacter sp.]
MYYIIKYHLQKGEGQFPAPRDIEKFNSNKPFEEIIRENLKFSFNNDNGLLPISDWKLVEDGLSFLALNSDGFDQGPRPVVWIHLEEEIDVEDEDAWADALSSDYSLAIAGINEEAPFYFQDHNGYSKVESAEWLADEIWAHLEVMLPNLKDNETIEIQHSLILSYSKRVTEDGIVAAIEMKLGEQSFVYAWHFDDEDALSDVSFSNSEYSDSIGTTNAEENPAIYTVHRYLIGSNS